MASFEIPRQEAESNLEIAQELAKLDEKAERAAEDLEGLDMEKITKEQSQFLAHKTELVSAAMALAFGVTGIYHGVDALSGSQFLSSDTWQAVKISLEAFGSFAFAMTGVARLQGIMRRMQGVFAEEELEAFRKEEKKEDH